MPLTLGNPPVNGMKVVQNTVTDLFRSGTFPRLAGATAEAGGPSGVEVARPQEVYELSLQQLTQGNNLSAARPVGWRYLVLQSERPVADVQTTHGTEQGGPRLAHVAFGPRPAASLQAIESAEGLSAVQAGAFELRHLQVPGLNVFALWLKADHTEDLLVPILDAQGLIAQRAYPATDFLARLRQPAQKRLAFNDAPVRIVTLPVPADALSFWRQPNESWADYFVRIMPPPVQPFLAMLQDQSVGPLLEMGALGGGELDLRVPAAIYATGLSDQPDEVSWRSVRFSQPTPAAYLSSLSAGADLGEGAVRWEAGIIRARPSALPADGRWCLFCLADDPDPSATFEREVFLLRRSPAGTQAAGPAQLVGAGLLVQGWQAAVGANWRDEQLIGLLLVLYAKMEALIAEYLRQPPPPDQFVANVGPLLDVLKEEAQQDLAARREGLKERTKPRSD